MDYQTYREEDPKMRGRPEGAGNGGISAQRKLQAAVRNKQKEKSVKEPVLSSPERAFF